MLDATLFFEVGFNYRINMRIPRHVAIVMDGNNRWAKKNHMPRLEGHRSGVKALSRTMDAAAELGIEYLTVYAFSVDNWNRSKEEVDGLMGLLRRFLKTKIKEIKKKGVCLIVIGRREGLPDDIIKSIDKAMEETKGNNKLKLVIALNYGGRSEIVDAVKKINADIKEEKIVVDDINEKTFGEYLYTKDIPDPDLFIRTSGEMRLSNFLLWQVSYAELWVTPVFWPDFGKEHLQHAIEDFNQRDRRYGGRKG